MVCKFSKSEEQELCFTKAVLDILEDWFADYFSFSVIFCQPCVIGFCVLFCLPVHDCTVENWVLNHAPYSLW